MKRWEFLEIFMVLAKIVELLESREEYIILQGMKIVVNTRGNYIQEYADESAKGKHKFMFLGRRSYIEEAFCEAETSLVSILIGHYTSIAWDVHFEIGLNNDHDYYSVSNYGWAHLNLPYNVNEKLQILIGSDVWIGKGSCIKGGVTIGNGAVIASNSVVTKNVPPYAIVGGNPAQIIKYRFCEDIIKKLNLIKWWYWEEKDIIENHSLFLQSPEAFCERFYSQGNSIKDNAEMRDITSSFKRNRDNIYFFVADLAMDEDSICMKLMKQFWEKNAAELLVIQCHTEEEEEMVQQITTYMNSIKPMGGNIYCVVSPEIRLDILKESTHFITNKMHECLIYVDYAAALGVNVIMGVSDSIFPQESNAKITS